jgi:hypothetical protein
MSAAATIAASQKSADGRVERRRETFQVTLIPPKGSPYSAANIRFRIVATGDNQEKGRLTDPLLQVYKGPVSITEDECIVYVATFHGFAACDFATKSPPEVARVAHPVLVHSSGPHGTFFVDVTPGVPRVTYFYAQGFEPRPQAAAGGAAVGTAAVGTAESVATGAPRIGATPDPKWKILTAKERRLRMLFEPTGAGACTAIVIGQMEGMADSAPATLVFQVGQASAVTISPTQNGLHFDLGPEPGTTVRFCYGVNKGGDATLKGLKLPRSPFGWTAVDADSQQVAEGGGVDVCFGGALGELRELERIGNTLHVWAQAAAIGMVPSPIVQWKTNLRSHVRRVTIVPSQVLDDGSGIKSGLKTALHSVAESSSRFDARFPFDARASRSEIDAVLPAFLQSQ